MEGPQNQNESSSAPKPNSDGRFPKTLRLSGHSASDRLFSLGVSFGRYPFRFVYLAAPPPNSPPYGEAVGVGLAQVSFLISVPKRQVRLATSRNRLKRQMREAIRMNFRQTLLPLLPPGLHLEVAILFTGGKNKFSFAELEKKLISGFRRLADKAASNPAPAPLKTLPPSLPPSPTQEGI